MKKSNTKHLTFKDRTHIETMMNESLKLYDIANALKRDPHGIKYEIIHHRQLIVRSNAKNKCGIQNSCKISRLCDICTSGLCKYCSVSKCSSLCPDFQEYPTCKSTLRFPYVCNGCKDLTTCVLPKWFYKAHIAHSEYECNVSNPKKKIKFDDVQLKDIDYILSQGVRNGNSIGVIINKNSLDIAPSTVYRYIDQNRLSIKNVDLKRKVRYRQRYTNKPKTKPLNYDYLNGRKFSDYGSFLIEHPSVNLWQMDTVEGIKGDKEAAVLTLHYTKTNLQLYFKINRICSEEVVRIFNGIKSYLGTDIFKDTFSCILTDNGKEFKDPTNIETDPITGEKLISIFYCDSRHSEQKGKCEKNHEHFRECIPKGHSINPYTHADTNYISNQVNNYPWKMFSYQSPYEISKVFLNEKVLELNHLHFIHHNKVVLKHLIKK